jgi:hypothetical protein
MKEMTKEEAKAIIRKVMGPPMRILEGVEKEQILMLLAMVEPFKETNNQRSWTSYYTIGDTEYHVSTFSENDVLVEEKLKEEE